MLVHSYRIRLNKMFAKQIFVSLIKKVCYKSEKHRITKDRCIKNRR